MSLRKHQEEHPMPRTENSPHSANVREKIGRRQFLTSTAATAVSFSVVSSGQVRGSQANSKITFGMIGCGMRGTWIADLFMKHGGYQLVGAADYFQDSVDKFGERFGVLRNRRYTTLSGYKQLLEQGVDAVVIESPPYFHPIQAKAALDAGTHVFLAKPIAVDVPGTQLVGKLGKEASSKNLCLLVDFQTRTNSYYQEAVKRVHGGDIGKIGFGEAQFNGGDVWNTWNPIGLYLKDNPSDPEARLRAWGLDKALSGDILVEQCIHSIDVATWIMNAVPETAYGSGGRFHYENATVWDCFGVSYRFPGEIPVLVHAKQFGKGYSAMGCRIQGLTGTVDTNYGGAVEIRGDHPYKGGNTASLYPDGASSNITDFYRNITEGRFENETVAPSVQSHLAAILGRQASYARREVGWQEMIKSDEVFTPDILEKLKT